MKKGRKVLNQLRKGMKYEKLIPEWVFLYESGMSFREIGRKYEVDPKTVNRTITPFIKKRRVDKWFTYADEWYDLYVNHAYSRSDIAKKYDTNVGQVSKVLKSKGVPSERARIRKYEHLIPVWKEDYKKGDSLHIIAKRSGVTAQTVLNYLNEEEVKIRTTSEAIRRMELDEHYFDELTEEKAYHLGLLFAMGSALELHNSYATQISAGESRRHLLEPLMMALRGEVEGVYVGTDKVERVRFNSQYLYESLKNNGFNSKNDMRFPSLEERFLPSFVYGYIEGASFIPKSDGYLHIDGSLSFLKTLKEELSKVIDGQHIVLKKRRVEDQYRIVIVSDVLEELKVWFKEIVDYQEFRYLAKKTWVESYGAYQKL